MVEVIAAQRHCRCRCSRGRSTLVLLVHLPLLFHSSVVCRAANNDNNVVASSSSSNTGMRTTTLTEFVNPNNIQAHITTHTNTNNNNNNNMIENDVEAKFPNPIHGKVKFTISSSSNTAQTTTTSIAVASTPPPPESSTTTTKTMIVNGRVCTNTPNWVDKYNDTCDFYEKIDASTPNRCRVWGDKGAKINKFTGVSLGVANDNCCICGGGSFTTTTEEEEEEEGNENDEKEDVVVNPGGTCGKGRGDRGNGICANGLCCSEFGWCGDTQAHCTTSSTTPPPPPPPPKKKPTRKPTLSSPSVTGVVTRKPTTRKPRTRKPTPLPTYNPTYNPTTPSPTDMPTDYPTYAPITDSPTGSSMPSFNYNDPKAWNHGTFAIASELDDDNGSLVITTPPSTKVGDTLFLFLSRTDAYMPIRLAGWKRGASCYKKNNEQPSCFLARDCIDISTSGTNCNKFEIKSSGYVGSGSDLGTIVFYRTVLMNDPSSWTITFDQSTRRVWTIVTSISNVNQTNPIRSAAGTSCDNVTESAFPSVYGKPHDVLLLSQSFDDTASRDDFVAPSGTYILGRTISRDEFGILFGKELLSVGPTGKYITGGKGGSKCKDALLSIVVNRSL